MASNFESLNQHIMRFSFLLLLLLGGISNIFAQPEAGLWFQPEAMQANQVNPAYTGEKKVAIGLPGIGMTFANSAFAIQDAFLGPEGSDLDIGPLIDRLDEQVYGRGWLDLRGMSLSIKLGRAQVGLDYHVRGLAYVRYNKDLAELLWYGNGPYVDQTMTLDTDFQFNAWQDLGLRFSLPMGERIRLGARLHYLAGIGDISSERSQLSLYTDPEYYQVTVQTDYLIRSSLDFPNLDSLTIDQIPNPFALGNNPGYALDLGAQIPINDQLEIGVSVLNLGSITWQQDPVGRHSKGEYTFDGLDVGFYTGDGELGLNNIGDSLVDVFGPEEVDQVYSSPLPLRALAGVTWSPDERLRLGLLYEREIFRGQTSNAIAAHASVNLQKILYLGLNYTHQSQYDGQLGVQAMLQAGPVQIVAMSNNILSMFRYWEGRNANLRLGLNLTIGKADWSSDNYQDAEMGNY